MGIVEAGDAIAKAAWCPTVELGQGRFGSGDSICSGDVAAVKSAVDAG